MKKNWLSKLIPRSNEIEVFQPPAPAIMEKVLLTGDLKHLDSTQRLSYYDSVCRSLGLNPLTKPFEYIELGGKLTLYARKDCTEQLRRRYNITLKILSRDLSDGVVTVTAQAQMPNGRQDESIGSVNLPAAGEARANAMMKAETKAKRRVTLSICGLGMFDESEMDTIFAEEAIAGRQEARETEAGKAKGAAIEVIDESPVDGKNYRLVVCHIGKAEGPILGKTIGELHPKALYWLRDTFGAGEGYRWGNPADAKDLRLKTAVDVAIAKLDEE